LKKILKILLIIVLVFVIVIAGFLLWQWKNIESILMGVSQSSEQIEQMRNENQETLVGDVNNYMDSPAREMTQEELEQIESGETTTAEVYQKIFEEKSIDTENSPKEQDIPNTKDKDRIISQYMSELYRLQNEYTAKAEATIAQGASYYESIKKHPQDATARASTITKFTSVVRNLEKECDTKVESVIKNMTADLNAIGADTSIIQSVRATYANEKRLKLSYYSNKYLK